MPISYVKHSAYSASLTTFFNPLKEALSAILAFCRKKGCNEDAKSLRERLLRVAISL